MENPQFCTKVMGTSPKIQLTQALAQSASVLLLTHRHDLPVDSRSVFLSLTFATASEIEAPDET